MKSQLLTNIKKIVDVAHKQADCEMNTIQKACKEGCNACCYQIVDVFTWEEPSIFEYIEASFDKNKKKMISKNLKHWFKKFNNNTRDADRSNPLDFQEVRDIQYVFREKRIPCPFLINSICSIYEVRPLACRVHYEARTADTCRNNPHHIAPKDAQEIFHRAVDKFEPKLLPIATKPLAYLVAEDFDINIQSKPMVGIIYDPNNMFSHTFNKKMSL